MNAIERSALPAKQAVADLFAKISVKFPREAVLLVAGWWLYDVDGRLIKANKRLASEIGRTNAKRTKRQPPRSAMKPMIGAPMTYDRAPLATIQPIAFVRFSNGKCSPISVIAIGVTMAVPIPLREYDISIKLKFWAKKHPNAAIVTDNSPAMSNDLCLNRTLRTPMNRAKMTATI